MKGIIVAIEGNVPSYKAHSVTTAKMADGFQNLSPEPVTFLFGASLKSLLRSLKFRGIKYHYGISRKIELKSLHCPLFKDYYLKTINIDGVVEKFTRFIEREKSNIYFVYARSFRFSIACIQKGVPVVMETHASSISNGYFKEVIKVASHPCFVGIVTIHEKLKALYIKAGVPADKIIVLHDGFSSNLFESERPFKVQGRTNSRNVLKATYVGALFEEKGIRDILELSRLAKLRGLEVDFQIYGGEPSQVKSWKCEHRKLGGGNNLKFYGFISNSLVPEVLKQSDILLMPYPKLEKFNVMDIDTTSPLKLFEYMASKKPILSTNLPVISSVLDHGKDAYLGELGNIEDHYEGLRLMVADRKYRKSLANNSFEKSFEYSWEKRSERLYRFVKDRLN